LIRKIVEGVNAKGGVIIGYEWADVEWNKGCTIVLRIARLEAEDARAKPTALEPMPAAGGINR
jgi:hypothetical protein